MKPPANSDFTHDDIFQDTSDTRPSINTLHNHHPPAEPPPLNILTNMRTSLPQCLMHHPYNIADKGSLCHSNNCDYVLQANCMLANLSPPHPSSPDNDLPTDAIDQPLPLSHQQQLTLQLLSSLPPASMLALLNDAIPKRNLTCSDNLFQ